MTIASAFEKHVHCSRGVLRICDDLYHVDSYSRVMVISFGLLAHDMAAQFHAQVGSLMSGIIASAQTGSNSQLAGYRYFHGSHPLPDAESARAADAVLRSLAALDAKSLVIFLISAGSSIVESFMDKAIAIDEVAAVYRVLSESQAPPSQAKSILKHLSSVKGGRMALAAGKNGAQQVSIFIGADPKHADVLACGPTMPDASTAEDCYRIADRYRLNEKFPASVRELFECRALDETPDKDHPAFHNCRWWPIS